MSTSADTQKSASIPLLRVKRVGPKIVRGSSGYHLRREVMSFVINNVIQGISPNSYAS